MECYYLQEDRPLFGKPVPGFLEGVPAAFDSLMQQITHEKMRGYYGLSKMDESGKLLYWVAAEEKLQGEAEAYGCERFLLSKGDYLALKLKDWKAQITCIKDLFAALMKDPRADLGQYCVEWYYSNDEMMCMLKANPLKLLFSNIDDTSAVLLQLLSPLGEDQLNQQPFAGNWTPAQLATHIIKSNHAIIQAMDLEGRPAERDPAERREALKKTFLDVGTRTQARPFIMPEQGRYEKSKLLADLNQSNLALKNKRTDRLEEAITFGPFGQVTRLELFYFVLYHTQRHIHQLRRMLEYI